MEHWQRLENARMEVRDRLRRLGYEPTGEQFATSLEALKKQSAQYRLRCTGEKPVSMEECTAAVLEALIDQGGILANDGDGVSCVVQMIWAQHERAERAEALAASNGDRGTAA